jgi:hypothetical protein
MAKKRVWRLKPPTEADFQRAQRMIARKRKPPRKTDWSDCLGDVPEEVLFCLWAIFGITHYSGPGDELPRWYRHLLPPGVRHKRV